MLDLSGIRLPATAVRLTLTVALGFASLAAHAAGNATLVRSTLETPDQRAVEAQASRIVANPRFQREVAASYAKLRDTPAAHTRDGARTLRPALEELAYAAALNAANSDPQRPRVVWVAAAPHRYAGRLVPGSRWGIDNPDNVYRDIPVDGASRYELSVTPQGPEPVQFSFLVYDSFVGEEGRRDSLDKPVAGLKDTEIKRSPDGSFRITVDSGPAAGQVNHIQINDRARVLLIRNTLSDWATQRPLRVSVKRLGSEAPAAPASESALVARAVAFLSAGTDTVLSLKSAGALGSAIPNAIAAPFARGGAWGFAASGNYNLADGEALVVTLDPLGAKYLGFDLTDPWLVSREHIRSTGSLNAHQADRNPDGTYTYVVAARDPGVANWVDTGGIGEGQILVRWQALADAAPATDRAVRSVRVVKIADLRAALPAAARAVTPAQRQKLSAERAAAYALRYASTPTATSVARN